MVGLSGAATFNVNLAVVSMGDEEEARARRQADW
jgi:hypothetical protein